MTKGNGMVMGVLPFTGPWNWGLNFNMNEAMCYAWSSKKGALLAYTSPS